MLYPSELQPPVAIVYHAAAYPAVATFEPNFTTAS